VKNTLAVVQSIAHQTEITSRSPREFVDRFSGRLQALANAHGVLVKSDWQGADLAALTRAQLQPYTADRQERLHIEGPTIALPPDLATPFSLVLHELATNAAKYGALAQPAGNVSVTWRLPALNGGRGLQLTWRESGAPPQSQPRPTGLGSRLIENAIPGANVRREFAASGLVCTIELQLPEEKADGQ
jgi:two-component system CheB/CheR fusion protein